MVVLTTSAGIRRAKLDREINIGLVVTMWGQFQNLGIDESHVIDTTDCSAQDTVSMIKEKMMDKAALLIG